jgi:hypothetical protein
MNLIRDIEELEPAIKDKLFFLADAVIRDAKTKKSLYALKKPQEDCLRLLNYLFTNLYRSSPSSP